MAYVGLFLDLTIAFFLLNRRTRPWAFGFAICFHLLNMLIFNIGIFPYLSVSLTALYFSPAFPRTIIRKLAARLSWVDRLVEAWRKRMTITVEKNDYLWQKAPRFRPAVVTGLILLASFHLLVPLRHHLFPGNVAWTEEGHRYSWRMMLRSKQGKGYFRLEHEGGATETIDPGEYLSSRQERKMYTHPDMILQFAHFIKDRFKRPGEGISVYAEIEARLNGRPYQTYIDPSVDLAGKEWAHFCHSDWILPLARE
jgi:hypothetical protein